MGKIIDEAIKNKIKEFREKGLTIEQTSLALEISESSVQRYSSNNPDNDNKLDEKMSNEMTKIMLLEGYDFEDEIKPIIYALKDEVNEMDITLYDYLNDVKNNTKTFRRLTDKPIRFYYIFMLLASKLNLITDHINAEDLINAVDNFYEREIEMEESEKFIAESETKGELILANTKEIWEDCKERIENIKKEATKEIEEKSRTLLKNSKQDLKEYNEKIKNAQKELSSLSSNRTLIIGAIEKIEIENQKLKKTLKKIEIENQKLKQLLEKTDKEKSLLEKVFIRIGAIFPEEVKSIVSEIENERKQPQ